MPVITTAGPESNSPIAVAAAPAPAAAAIPATARLSSLDVFRGATMLFMASEIMRISSLGRAYPDSGFARTLSSLLDHRAWVGCAPWDLIQPAFMFMVGVSLPFSIASRRARGQSFGRMFGHSVFRAFILIALGIFLRSQGRSQTNFTFEDVLTQIGLGYIFLFLLGWARPKVQWAAAIAILVGYWGAFALYPLPPADFDTTTVGVAADWPHKQTGFARHWDKNTNLAHAADVWFLNLFPRERPFVANRGGYLTLNFVPSLATMIFGLLAGGWLRSDRPGRVKLQRLVIFGAAGILLGWLLHAVGVCPLVKRIWTPSWTLFSAGWVTLMLAGFYYVVDLRGYKKWAFPLLVVGMNSIAMYVLVHVAERYIERSLTIHLGRGMFESLGAPFTPILLGGATLAIFWLILLWMYKNRVFVRI
jgi:heparan-alpha-glucosaminide N-acetyltransferase